MKTKHVKNMLLSLLAGCMLVAGGTALSGSTDQVTGSYTPEKYLQQVQLLVSWMQGENPEKPKTEKTSNGYVSEEDKSLKALHELMAQIAICR